MIWTSFCYKKNTKRFHHLKLYMRTRGKGQGQPVIKNIITTDNLLEQPRFCIKNSTLKNEILTIQSKRFIILILPKIVFPFPSHKVSEELILLYKRLKQKYISSYLHMNQQMKWSQYTKLAWLFIGNASKRGSLTS